MTDSEDTIEYQLESIGESLNRLENNNRDVGFIRKHFFSIVTLILTLTGLAVSFGVFKEKVVAMENRIERLTDTVESVVVPREEFNVIKDDVRIIKEHLLEVE